MHVSSRFGYTNSRRIHKLRQIVSNRTCLQEYGNRLEETVWNIVFKLLFFCCVKCVGRLNEKY